jgi:DNA-binding MarR family transcriptional regulator
MLVEPRLDAIVAAASFRSALRGFLRRTEQCARENGLTPRQYLLLLLVMGAPDGSATATIGDLVDRLALTQSTVTELVQRAEESGLLERKTSADDGRIIVLRVTDEGRRRLLATYAALGPEREHLSELLRD